MRADYFKTRERVLDAFAEAARAGELPDYSQIKSRAGIGSLTTLYKHLDGLDDWQPARPADRKRVDLALRAYKHLARSEPGAARQLLAAIGEYLAK